MKFTTRAVLYIGYHCNLNCQFCYYHFSNNKKWKKLASAKFEAHIYRKIFGDDRVDITGGEPTIYPNILKLVQFCKKIGLRPSIITNGIALANERNVILLKDAGVFDYLVSIHGLGNVYDYLVSFPGAYDKQNAGLKNLIKNNIPIRINVTINKYNTPQLPEVAKYAADMDAKVVNFICFNPFYEWRHNVNIEFQEQHSTVVPYLREAIDILNVNGIESNVRYFPLCLLKGLESHQYNFHQLSYDSHEWDFMSWHKNSKIVIPFLLKKFLYRKTAKEQYAYYLKDANISTDINYCKPLKCNDCAMRNICDGLVKQYYERFGDYELEPYSGEQIKDPTTFIKDQFKIDD